MTRQLCDNCRFFYGWDNSGVCRRFQPKIVEELFKHEHGEGVSPYATIRKVGVAEYPAVSSAWWCGEWKHASR